MAEGNVLQIIGPSVDIRFPENQGPQLLNAIKIKEGSTVTFAGDPLLIQKRLRDEWS